MPLTTRPYESEDDLAAMRRLLVSGRLAGNGTYYVHSGDLAWWFSYFNPDRDPRPFTTLWEGDAFLPGELAAWTLFSPAYNALDVFVHPTLRGTPAAETIWIEAEEKFAAQQILAGRKKICTLWIAESDDWTVTHLLARGFTRGGDYMDVLVRSLSEPIEPPALPAGYTLRSPLDEGEAALRAAPQYSAFQSDMPFEEYAGRYTRFMRSAAYPAGFDVMLLNAEGQAAAFCVTWPDPVNRVGLLEPVGVHADYHRQGLGRMVVYEGLRRLQACGMRSALVCGLSDLPEACAFYTRLGFQPVLRLRTFEKRSEF